MAAAAHAESGDRDTSRKIWEIIYETNPSEGRRNFALRNLREIQTMDIEDGLTVGLREYKKRYDKLPESVQDMVRSGIVRAIPESPLEGEYIIASRIEAVKDTVFAERNLNQGLRFLNAKSKRYKKAFGEYPKDLKELRIYIENYTTTEFPVHPLGEDYLYDPPTGKVTSGEITK